MQPAQRTFLSEFDRVRADNELRASLRVVAERDGATGPATSAGSVADPAADDAALAELRDLAKQTGATPATIAKRLGVRPGVVELLLANPEKIPAEHRATLVARVRDVLAGELAAKRAAAAGFVRTAPVGLIVGVARTVCQTRTIGLVTGGAGMGKSVALRAIAAELSGRIVTLRADTDSRSAKGLMRAVGMAAGDTNSAARPSVKRGVDLTRSASLLVIDEAQLLSASAIEATRGVHDVGGVPVLLVGTTALGRAVSADADPLIAPLASRIALRIDLDRELLTPGPTGKRLRWLPIAELRAILATAVAADFEPDALTLLGDIANNAPGHIRRAVNAARVAAVLAADGKVERPTIDADTVRSALDAAGGQAA